MKLAVEKTAGFGLRLRGAFSEKRNKETNKMCETVPRMKTMTSSHEPKQIILGGPYPYVCINSLNTLPVTIFIHIS